ncbi:ACP S-malonyltransferase [Reyranella soli]|uniref:ACP S-malonyltransferase n=1 Tax=Reyranella soli TaxID=1230389 RepID=A0A512NMD1_9HYPH|nr:ACP S-malonyltransferase [Reyranella soli]
MTLALLCSGQGLQSERMFALTGDALPAAGLFEHAARLLGGDARDLVRQSDDATLHGNRVGQVLCTLQAVAAQACLGDAWPRPLVVAGYSVGEVAAWSVAGLVAPETALDLVARRADAMDAASSAGDGLLFVRGLTRATVETLCRLHDAAIAIVNPGDAYVLGGNGASLDALAIDAKARGASRVVAIAVRVASHTPRLSAAAAAFREFLKRAPVANAPVAGVRLLSSIDGDTVVDVGAGIDKLAAQVSQTVQWATCLDACVEAGATAFLELGPGRALAEMALLSHSDLPARSLDDFRTLDGVRAWLGRVAA